MKNEMSTEIKKEMLYLVNCKVVESYYMNDDTEISEVNHIVEAETEKEAINKVQNHYSKKYSEYYFSNSVSINYCNEVIS